MINELTQGVIASLPQASFGVEMRGAGLGTLPQRAAGAPFLASLLRATIKSRYDRRDK
jgi:hypothetical protein